LLDGCAWRDLHWEESCNDEGIGTPER
jgi:hypothetical protein